MQNLQMAFKNKKKVFLKSIKSKNTKSRNKYKRVALSTIRYAGGKSLAVGHVFELLPNHVKKVVSPFFGGGSVEIAMSKVLGLNVVGYDIGLSKIADNNEIQNLIQSLGCGIGKNFEISKLRYEKIILMTDADVDGSHIATLLITFFYKYMKSLIDENKLYLAMPPLFKIYNKNKSFYAYDIASIYFLTMSNKYF